MGALRVLGATLLITNLGVGLFEPLFPIYLSRTGLTVQEIGLVLSMFSIASALAMLVWGRLMDALERKKLFIILGLFSSAAAYYLLVKLATYYEFLALRTLHGAMAAAAVPAIGILVSELSGGRPGRTMGAANTLSDLGLIIGMAAGSLLLYSFGIQKLPLFSSAVVLAAALLFASRAVEAPKKLMRQRLFRPIPFIVERRSFRPLRAHWKMRFHIRKSLLPFYLSMFLIIFSSVLVIALFPVYLTGFSVPLREIFWMLALGACTAIATHVSLGALADVLGARKPILIGMLVRASLFLLLPLADSKLHFYLFQMLMGVSWAMIVTPAYSLLMRTAREGERGKLLGTYNTFFAMAFGAAPLSSGYLIATLGYAATFQVGALTALMAVLTFKLISK